MLKINRTFEIVTEESAADGEAAEVGFLAEGEAIGFRSLVARVTEGGWLCSQSPLPADDAGFERVWISSDPVQDYRTGGVGVREHSLCRQPARPEILGESLSSGSRPMLRLNIESQNKARGRQVYFLSQR